MTRSLTPSNDDTTGMSSLIARTAAAVRHSLANVGEEEEGGGGSFVVAAEAVLALGLAPGAGQGQAPGQGLAPALELAPAQALALSHDPPSPHRSLTTLHSTPPSPHRSLSTLHGMGISSPSFRGGINTGGQGLGQGLGGGGMGGSLGGVHGGIHGSGGGGGSSGGLAYLSGGGQSAVGLSGAGGSVVSISSADKTSLPAQHQHVKMTNQMKDIARDVSKYMVNICQCPEGDLYTIQYNTIHFNAIQYNTIQCTSTQYNTMQYNTIQYNTLQRNTIQCNTPQYNTMHPIHTINSIDTIHYHHILPILFLSTGSLFTFPRLSLTLELLNTPHGTSYPSNLSEHLLQ